MSKILDDLLHIEYELTALKEFFADREKNGGNPYTLEEYMRLYRMVDDRIAAGSGPVSNGEKEVFHVIISCIKNAVSAPAIFYRFKRAAQTIPSRKLLGSGISIDTLYETHNRRRLVEILYGPREELPLHINGPFNIIVRWRILIHK